MYNIMNSNKANEIRNFARSEMHPNQTILKSKEDNAHNMQLLKPFITLSIFDGMKLCHIQYRFIEPNLIKLIIICSL